MEKQVNRESQNELLERHQYPISEKRHVSDRFSAVRGKRPYDRPSIPDDVINDALHIRSSDTEEYTTPEDEDEVKMLSRAKADDNTFEDYRKRDPSAGFSPARGKRLPLRADDIPYKRPSSAADFSYKRGPPQGFSSVRGKRPSSYLSDKRAPPGGFSSVRGKRRMAYHDRRSEQTTFGNPFFRLVLSDPDEPPKRTPPSGFSFARGKKDARDDLYDLGMRASRERVPRQDYYKSMVNRLMSGKCIGYMIYDMI